MVMNCKQPVVLTDREAFPCGQCLPCRINRRRVWAHRIMLEAGQYSENSFVTLTYDDEHIPENHHLVPRDLQLFIKRFRKKISPDKVRYFAVGEYGDETLRPHYHLALFGYGSCLYGVSRYGKYRKNCCIRCDLVRDSWEMGNVVLGTLEAASASYVARYVAKKISHKTAIEGRPREFARMSLRPGIGGDAMHEVASQLMRYGLEETMVDVPNALRHGRKLLPLGRYLRKRLRLMTGGDGKVPEAAVEELRKELQPMLEAAEAIVPRGIPHAYELRKSNFGDQLDKAAAGKVASIEAKERIFNRRGSL